MAAGGLGSAAGPDHPAGQPFPAVGVSRYVTEGNIDAYMWQAVTRKAIFIAQAMRGNLDVREMEDIGDQALNANEVKALATGDPLILDKAQADADLNRLERLKRAHDQTRYRLRETIRRHERAIEQLTAENDTLQHAIEQRTDTRGDAFACVVRPQTIAKEYGERVAAGEALREILRNRMGDNGPVAPKLGPRHRHGQPQLPRHSAARKAARRPDLGRMRAAGAGSCRTPN